MPVRLNGSTSGYTELTAPATAGNNALTLPTGNGSAYQMLRNGATAGSLEFVDNLVLGTAQNSTSGTNIDFNGIPSWVKRITVMFNGVSTNGTSYLQAQIGSGSVTTSGYAGGYSRGTTAASNTTGLIVQAAVGAAYNYYGVIIWVNVSGNTWVGSGNTITNASDVATLSNCSITLSGTLDRVRITTVNSTDTFDAGSINILYE